MTANQVPPLDMSAGALNSPDDCWVCGTSDELEEHHMIPRAYGGQYGPCIMLCAIDHSATHKVAENPVEEHLGVAFQLRPDLPNDRLTRLAILGKIICVARDLTEKDPNKTAVFSDRFPARTRGQLKDLAKQLKINQKKVVRLAIQELHKKIFG